MKKLKLLDVCCCEGGAAVGYAKAGFNVTGIDILSQKNYPFKFIQADGIEYLLKHGHKYNAIHISPPCQAYSCSTSIAKSKGKVYPDLLDKFRQAALNFDVPIIIENVMSAPMRSDVVLTGTMFNLRVIRKRKFELHNWFCMQPGVMQHKGTVKDGDFISVYGNGHYRDNKNHAEPKFKKESILSTWSFALGIEHKMSYKGFAECIPPAYTEFLGKNLIEFINNKTA